MVTLLKDFPPYVAAYRAQGTVSKEEYKHVVMHRVDEVANHYPKINFYVLLETGFEDYTLPAFLEYVKVSFEHFSKWNRMAIVSDQKWVRTVYDFLRPLVHGEIRTYPLADQEIGRKWVSASLDN